jgi:CRISPR/Cas system CMR-associated protein Cmr1 (group 7 of RAMP superfamily)
MRKATKFIVEIKIAGDEEQVCIYPHNTTSFTNDIFNAEKADYLSDALAMKGKLEKVFPFAYINIVVANVELVEQVNFQHNPDLTQY